MAAEPVSASLISRLSLSSNVPIPQGYYRSKLFTVPFTNNPLVAAAGPLFSLLERLSISPSLPPIATILENIEHELKAFSSRLDNKTDTEGVNGIAHYLLCASIDELIGKNYLRVYEKFAEFKAFTPLSYDEVGPESRFFDIVNYIKERPNQYLDLIELAYYCLIIGFEGQQHGRADGRQVLDNLIEELYQLIKLYRANKLPQLFTQQKDFDEFPKNHKPLIIGFFLAIVLLGSGYFISQTLLGNQASTVQFEHRVIAKLDD